jgi:hypothetical protein
MLKTIVKLTDEKNITVISSDNVEPVLEHNKKLRALEQTNTDGLKHIASIPNVIMVRWLNEEWMRGSHVRYLSAEWDELVAKKLNDPEWAFLRVDGPSHRVGWRS